MSDHHSRRPDLDPNLRERAAAMVRRMRRRLRQVRVRVGRMAEEFAVKLAERAGGAAQEREEQTGMRHDGAQGGDGMAKKQKGAERKSSKPSNAQVEPATVVGGRGSSRMVAEGGPVHPADVAAAAGEPPSAEARTEPPARKKEAEKAASRMVAEGSPVHPEAPDATEGADAGEDDEEEDPPFPLRSHLHTWLHGSSAPAAIQLLPVEPRRAWAWWRLDEAQRNAVKGEVLHLEILDAAGNRLQLHPLERPEGEWFLEFNAWLPQLSARVGPLEHGSLKPVLSTGPVEMPPERAGDGPVRWTDTARRPAGVRGIPAEYVGGDIPTIVAADGTLLSVSAEGHIAGAPSSVEARRLRLGPVSAPSRPSSASGRPSAGSTGDAGA